MKIFNRKGKFILNHTLIRKDPELARNVLNTVLVIRAENCFVSDEITYWAYSEHFEEIDQSYIPPEYEAIITGKDIVHWRKV